MKMNHLLYMIGIPGSGKSTLMARALEGVPVIGQASKPFAHVVYSGGCQLGRLRKEFSGTDALSMSVQPTVVEWLEKSCPYSIVVAEGDRLGNASFFLRVRQMTDWQLTLVYLDTPLEVAQQRCKGRGSAQDPTWWRGRVTKVSNLVLAFPIVRLDGMLALEKLADQMFSMSTIRALHNTP